MYRKKPSVLQHDLKQVKKAMVLTFENWVKANPDHPILNEPEMDDVSESEEESEEEQGAATSQEEAEEEM